jgi:formyltetrahydrofolate deformylase
MKHKKYILQIDCPDQKGLIAATTNVLHLAGANVLDLNQHSATDIERFFLRALFEVPETLPESVIRGHIGALAEQYQMNWFLDNRNSREQVALLVSKTDHCLHELLLNHKDGQLDCDFCCIISNHEDLRPMAENAGIPYFKVGGELEKPEREKRMNEILEEYHASTLVMARYMQILSSEFTERWQDKVINIHHGFLPAFQGAKPYHQAWKKGVKLIGATAHFATQDLDQGPIIWQQVAHLPDTASVKDFIQQGKDVERRTLSHALKLYLDRRVFVWSGRTFIL